MLAIYCCDAFTRTSQQYLLSMLNYDLEFNKSSHGAVNNKSQETTELEQSYSHYILTSHHIQNACR